MESVSVPSAPVTGSVWSTAANTESIGGRRPASHVLRAGSPRDRGVVFTGSVGSSPAAR